MGRVSLFEDIDDRLNDDAMNVVIARNTVTSIKHLPDGPGARSPRLRSEIATLWQEFEDAIQALDACNRRPLPMNHRKRSKAMIDKAIEGCWLKERMRESMAKLVKAYPSMHPDRVILEGGLRQI